MIKETREHKSPEHWKVVKKSEMPIGKKLIQAIWSFKHKCFPNGSLNKHKACLCAHGGMQQWGVNYWETYAPVVNWISIRFLLILSEVLQLDTCAASFSSGRLGCTSVHVPTSWHDNFWGTRWSEHVLCLQTLKVSLRT